MNEKLKRRLALGWDAIALAIGLGVVVLACFAVFKGATVEPDPTARYNSLDTPHANDLSMVPYYRAALTGDQPMFTRLSVAEHVGLNCLTLMAAGIVLTIARGFARELIL